MLEGFDMKKLSFYTIFILMATLIVMAGTVMAQGNGKGRPFHEGLIYVTSQYLYYETIVPVAPGKLPMNGPFQELRPLPGPDVIAETDFGPGDPGYVGGRWWVDNGSVPGEMDPDDTYFLCPLLGPGMPF